MSAESVGVEMPKRECPTGHESKYVMKIEERGTEEWVFYHCTDCPDQWWEKSE